MVCGINYGTECKGWTWCVMKNMYEFSQTVVLLEGEKLDSFSVEQSMVHVCSLSPVLFLVFTNYLLKRV